MTGQTASEVSDIVRGRPVRSYDLLVRIADGLGVPRGWMGLASGEKSSRPYGGDQATSGAVEEEDVRRRKGLATGGAMVLGYGGRGEVAAVEWLVSADEPAPPGRIGETDVSALRALTNQLLKLARGGHPAMPEVYSAVIQRSELLLDADATT